MKKGLPVVLTLIALAGSGVAFAAFNVNAQQPSSVAIQKTEKPAFVFTPADRAAFFDARVAALHAGLKLTPDQEKLWPAVETAVRTAAKNALDRHQKFQNEPQPESLIDRLRLRGENAVARGENLQAIANAAAPLYATLSEDQKHRLPVLLHGLRPHFSNRHFAMMDGGHEHWGWPRGRSPDDQEGFGPGDEGHDRSGPNDH